MPRKPPTICKHPGCAEKTSTIYCARHLKYEKAIKQEYEKRRPGASKRGYGHRWAKYSQARLKKWPLCEPCLVEKRTTAATITDHIVPPRSAGEDMELYWKLFWDPENHQSICDLCHRKKSAGEDGVLGNPVK